MTTVFMKQPVDRGDQVHQISPFGLAPLEGDPYVLDASDGELQLSRTPDGPPLTDLEGQPRHYPALKFRKVICNN